MQVRLQKLKERLEKPDHVTMLALALLFGIIAGVVAFVYNSYFEFLLTLTWEWVPERLVEPMLRDAHERLRFPSPDRLGWIYTLSVSTFMGTMAGLTQRWLGSPGDLPDTVRCIHRKGSIPIRQAPSMFICSAFSIAAGGSLGPEAALLALCGAAVSWVARKGLGYTGRNLRCCAIMGMTAGLAAFFGVALGGSLFALEVLHRTGMQFYEVATFAVACGTICLTVFRGLTRAPFGQVWAFPEGLPVVDFRHVLFGIAAGMVAACLAILFMHMYKLVFSFLSFLRLQEHHTPVASGMVGGFLIGLIGIFLPPTMFWGEFEIRTLANPGEVALPHIWPKGGFYGLSPFLQGEYTWWLFMLIGLAKLLTICLTVLSGFRGGFIFPLFFAGVAFGKGFALMPLAAFGSFPPVLFGMTIAAGLNTAITRTPLATTLILSVLSGVPQVTVPCLAAALTSLFITYNMPFIKPQQDRTDIHWKELVMIEEDGELVILGEVPVSDREPLEDSAHGGHALAQAHQIDENGELCRPDADPENPAGEDIMERVGGVHQPSTEPPPLSPLGVAGF
ncbi:hypothetical protein WJX74_008487 [Apatococcus lobatus]|uniref:Chloride channel protein n=1 Tax=Apatococcus lobatus TaxID=904363 RepID=A0AAW1QKE0_9CHLO